MNQLPTSICFWTLLCAACSISLQAAGDPFLPVGEGPITSPTMLVDFVDNDSVSMSLDRTDFKCKTPIIDSGNGFDYCELYVVPTFSAAASAVLMVFGHCEATIKYRTRDNSLEQNKSFFENFTAAVVNGSGLAQVTMTLKPLLAALDPIVEAKVANFDCGVDRVFDEIH
jgi:hypothetical protein